MERKPVELLAVFIGLMPFQVGRFANTEHTNNQGFGHNNRATAHNKEEKCLNQ
jgi:hypothetical protein